MVDFTALRRKESERTPAVRSRGVGKNQNRRKVAGGRKPAQPSIPEGILGFPPPDALRQCTPKTKAKLLKLNRVVFEVPGKKLLGVSKISVVPSGRARVSLSFAGIT